MMITFDCQQMVLALHLHHCLELIDVINQGIVFFFEAKQTVIYDDRQLFALIFFQFSITNTKNKIFSMMRMRRWALKTTNRWILYVKLRLSSDWLIKSTNEINKQRRTSLLLFIFLLLSCAILTWYTIGYVKLRRKNTEEDFFPFIVDMTSRSRCFFDMKIDGIDGEIYLSTKFLSSSHFFSFIAGRIVFELYNDICPRTCENFRSLCIGNRSICFFFL